MNNDRQSSSPSPFKNPYYAFPLGCLAVALILIPLSALFIDHTVFDEDPRVGVPGAFIGFGLLIGHQILLWRRQPPRTHGWGNVLFASVVAGFCLLVSPIIFVSLLNAHLGSGPPRELTQLVVNKEVTGEVNHLHSCTVWFDSPWEPGQTHKLRVGCPIDTIQPGASRIVLKVRRGRLGYEWISGHTLYP